MKRAGISVEWMGTMKVVSKDSDWVDVSEYKKVVMMVALKVVMLVDLMVLTTVEMMDDWKVVMMAEMMDDWMVEMMDVH